MTEPGATAPTADAAVHTEPQDQGRKRRKVTSAAAPATRDAAAAADAPAAAAAANGPANKSAKQEQDTRTRRLPGSQKQAAHPAQQEQQTEPKQQEGAGPSRRRPAATPAAAAAAAGAGVTTAQKGSQQQQQQKPAASKKPADGDKAQGQPAPATLRFQKGYKPTAKDHPGLVTYDAALDARVAAAGVACLPAVAGEIRIDVNNTKCTMSLPELSVYRIGDEVGHHAKLFLKVS